MLKSELSGSIGSRDKKILDSNIGMDKVMVDEKIKRLP